MGALLFTPAMADEAAEVHEQALKVLREHMDGAAAAGASHSAQPGGSVSTSISPTNAPKTIEEHRQAEAVVSQSRSEREARLKAEAAQRMGERELRQAEKRQQFADFIKERERVRKEQRVGDEKIVREAGQAMPVTGTAGTIGNVGQTAAEKQAEVHAKALEVLHSATAESSSTAATPDLTVSKPPLTEAEVAPAAVAQPGETNAEVQARALEILRREQSTSPNAAAVAPAGSPRLEEKSNEPTIEERQRRIREIEERVKARSSGTETAAPADPPVNAAPAKPPGSASAEPAPAPETPAPNRDDYARDLQQRALELVRQAQPAPQAPAEVPAAPVVTAAPHAAVPAAATSPKASASAPVAEPARPGLDNRTREIIQRQDREISRQAATPRRAQNARNLDPAAEARAREVLRQQQEALGSQPGTPAPAEAPAAASPAPVIATPSGAAPEIAAQPVVADPAYSKELEERARQIILERARSEQAAAAAPSVAATPTPAPAQPAAQPPVAAKPTPSPKPASAAEAQQRALEASRPVENAAPTAAVEAPAAAGPKTKQAKLREITELYRADKLTPAEYHQRRAEILAEP